ncbi:MAG TPA: hypothetical protein VGN36_06915, partial [Sphingorhabdus sp.]|nr:hypothetical protein [Sphingorhabdus sp.]
MDGGTIHGGAGYASVVGLFSANDVRLRRARKANLRFYPHRMIWIAANEGINFTQVIGIGLGI